MIAAAWIANNALLVQVVFEAFDYLHIIRTEVTCVVMEDFLLECLQFKSGFTANADRWDERNEKWNRQ